MANIFISYSRHDQDFATRLVQELDALGHDVWMDTQNLAGGDDWQRELERSIPVSDLVFVLWSKAASTSKWVYREIALADDRGKKIIVLTLDSTPVDNMRIQSRQQIKAPRVDKNLVVQIVRATQATPVTLPAVAPARPLLIFNARWFTPLMVAVMVVGLIVIGGIALLSSRGNESSATPATEPPAATAATLSVSTPDSRPPTRPAITLAPVAEDELLTGLIAQWPSPLAVNPVLQNIAGVHLSRVMGFTVPELTATPGIVYTDANGQDEQFMARDYGGTVALVVYVSETAPTADSLMQLILAQTGSDDLSRFSDIGLEQGSKQIAGLYYAVVFVGMRA